MRNISKEYRNIIEELVKSKQYDKVEKAIEALKVELGGEYKAVKKLNILQSYLSSELERYQDLVEVPEEQEGIEYRILEHKKVRYLVNKCRRRKRIKTNLLICLLREQKKNKVLKAIAFKGLGKKIKKLPTFT